jgi:CHRD domain
MLAVPVALAVAVTGCNRGDDEGGTFDLRLSGEEEVCTDTPQACGGPGTAIASVEVNSDRNEVCYDIRLTNVADATAAHIHKGEKGQAGGVVIDLQYEGDESGGEGCVDGIDETILEAVAQDPDQHYLNVHSERYPDGAARGQLKD